MTEPAPAAAGAGAGRPVRVVPVRGRRALRRFLGLPWRLHARRDHPGWVPPLRAMVRDTLGGANPFWASADRELFLAIRDGRPVGRIAAIENRAHNRFHGDQVGFFGFFETAEDPEVTRGLLSAAGAWLATRGLERMRGPVSPSTNHETGMLVEGFGAPPTFMTPWNPPWYPGLVEGGGLAKVKDLLAFDVPFEGGFRVPERYARVAERVRRHSGFRFRPFDLSDFPAEVERAWTVYNEAWELNWGFVPMSRAEFDHMAGMLRHLVLEDFACFAEVDGEPAAFALALPDYNRTLSRNPSGRLLPFGLPMLLRDRRRLRSGRALLLGVRERFRSRGAYALLVDELVRRAVAYGAERAEASWILEDNEALLGFFREAGLAPTRRWRLYEGPLSGP